MRGPREKASGIARGLALAGAGLVIAGREILRHLPKPDQKPKPADPDKAAARKRQKQARKKTRKGK